MKNPYKIEKPALISFSGGRTSAFMLYQILQAFEGALPDDVYVVFANTGKEVPETLDFINQCSINWNVKVRWLELDIYEERPIYRTKEVSYETASRNGEPFEALIDRKKFLPNNSMRICTAELKMKVMERFMRSQNHKEWFNVIGLRHDEYRRVSTQLKANRENKNRWETIMPLNTDKKVLSDIYNFWSTSNFDLNLPNHGGKTLAGNCDLCYLKGTQTLVNILREKPDLADWWIEQERKIKAWRNEDRGSQYGMTFKGNGMSYIKLLDITKLDKKQIELFDDDSRSCFCHD
jgi:3'-phosphoadenosine 5'-phosphosulfate sulfotransferase (PAPS reductase)/FAD synthetase